MIWKTIKSKIYIIIALFTALIFFYPLIFEERTLYFRDIQSIFYPMKYFLVQSLTSGSIPFWCPLYFCGAPFMSDIQTGVFYLPSLIFLVFSYPLSFNLYMIFHIILCFCFVYLFIREIGLSAPAAVFSAMAYSYGGYVLSSINLPNNLAVITWLPAMLWSYKRALDRKSFPYYLLTTFYLCLSILGGEPQLFLFSVMITFCFGLVTGSKSKIDVGSFLKYNLIFIAIITAALLITIIQWGPTFLDFQNSVRLKGLPFDPQAELSLSWNQLRHLMVPVSFSQSFGSDPAALMRLFPPQGKIPWLLSIYPGLLVTLFACLSVFSRPWREKIFWLALFVAGIVFSLGNSMPFFNLAHRIFPFFRFPEKYYFLSNIGLVVLSGYGFDRLILFLMKFGERTRYVLLIIPLMLFADLYMAHAGLNLTCKINLYQYSDHFLQQILRDRDLFRVYVDEDSFISRISDKTSIDNRHLIAQTIKASNIGVINNIHYVDGKTGMELQYQWIISEILRQPWTHRIKILQLANVKYIVSAENLEAQPEIMPYVQRINPIVFQIRDHLPRAWMVGAIQPLGLWTVQDYHKRLFDCRTTALGPESMGGMLESPYHQDVDNIVYENHNRIHIDIKARQRGVLVLSEAVYPGWHATVDGQPVNIIRLNYLFQGVSIGLGRHEILFEYQPPFFLLFATISISAFLIIVAVWFTRRKQFNKDRNSSRR